MIETLPFILLQDGFFAALAAIGFAVISNPPKRAVLAAAFLAAVGHAFRFYLLQVTHLDIILSTLFASMLMGVLSFLVAKLIYCPNETFTFPALLPMIPGMFAYKAILSLVKFLRSEDPVQMQAMLMDSFKNGFTAVFILIALVIGVSLPVMLFHKQSFMMTRYNRKGKR